MRICLSTALAASSVEQVVPSRAMSAAASVAGAIVTIRASTAVALPCGPGYDMVTGLGSPGPAFFRAFGSQPG
jgi:hypothetical protein